MGSLGDHAIRACDLCADEILNRLIRIRQPLFPVMFTAASGINPRRSWPPFTAEDSGDYCVGCVAVGRVAPTHAGDARLMEHAPEAQLRQLVHLGRQLVGQTQPSAPSKGLPSPLSRGSVPLVPANRGDALGGQSIAAAALDRLAAAGAGAPP